MKGKVFEQLLWLVYGQLHAHVYIYIYKVGIIILESNIEANLTAANDLFVMYDIACSLHSHLNVKFMSLSEE